VRRQKLLSLGIPCSTYYRWQRLYRDQGGDGLQGKRREKSGVKSLHFVFYILLLSLFSAFL
jgi:transposase